MSRAGILDRRKPQRGDRRRASLLHALDELLQDGDLDEINIADIAGRAGVTRSAFYFYFENKSAAVAALVSDMYEQAFAAAAHLTDERATPRERIEATIRGLFASLRGNEHMYRAMHAARQTNRDVQALWDADRASFVGPVAAMIDAERAAGHAPDGPPSGTLATVLLELNDVALERVALGGGPDGGSPAVDLGVDARVDVLVTVWLRTIYGRIDEKASRRRAR